MKFANPPEDNKIRAAMLQKIKTEVSVQDLTGSGAVNEVEVSLPKLMAKARAS